MVNPAWEELAKLYLRIDGKVYRFKIFPKHVGIEQQPGGRHWLTVNAKRKVLKNAGIKIPRCRG